MKTAILTLTLALLSAPATAGGLAFFRGTPGTPGDVVVARTDGTSVVPPGLDGIRLLALEVNGRSVLERFLPGKAWLETDVPLAARAVLPSRAGSVYHFVRHPVGLGATFGYFVVDATGEARLVFELPGTGPAADQDPFLPAIAVAPDGLVLLLGTTLPAGGDLYEVSLTPGGSVVPRTDQLAPQDLLANSLTLTGAWGLGVSTSGVLRFPRPASDQASFLTYSGPAPTWWSGDVVLSGNGAFAALVAGNSPPLGDVWVCGSTGPANRASTTTSVLSGAGYLPAGLHGPYMGVSDDGSTAAWRIETAITREAFLAEVQPPPGHTPVQVSSDTYFLDTLDEIGQYAFKPASRELVMALGALSPNLPATLESADYFAVRLDPNGAPLFTNITQTNGVAQAPFLVPPLLNPLSASWTPGHKAILFHDDKGGNGGQLALMRPDQTGVQVLQDAVKEVFHIDQVGAEYVVVLRRATGNKDLELHLVNRQLTGSTSFFTTPDTDQFPLRAVRSDRVYTFVQRTPTHDWMWAFDPRTSALGLMTQRKLRFGPTLAVGPNDEVGFRLGPPDTVDLFASWHFPDIPKRMPVVPQAGFLLPGA